jgi:hypothetical protein
MERCGRPGEPLLISGDDIEQNVAVDEYGGALLAARQSHDGVGAPLNVAASPQTRDEPGSSPIPAALLRADKANRLAVKFEIYLGVRKKASLLADFNGDGHLTLGGDAHVSCKRSVAERSDQAGSAFADIRGLLKRIPQLQYAPVVVMAANNLQPNWKPT